MDISLTPQELRDLLTPPLLRMRVHPTMNLDALTGAGEPTIAEDRSELGAQRTLVVALADLAQAQEELSRVRVMVEEKASELSTLIVKIGELKATPVAQANAVIERAGRQAEGLARMFLLESSSGSWYQGMRTGLREILSTLGVEIDDVTLEESLQPPESEPPAAAPATLEDLGVPEHPGLEFNTEEEMIRTLASDEPRPALALVPPAGSSLEALTDRALEIEGLADGKAEPAAELVADDIEF